jgi:hypothetical protein
VGVPLAFFGRAAGVAPGLAGGAESLRCDQPEQISCTSLALLEFGKRVRRL